MGLTHTQFVKEYKLRLEELGFEGLTNADVKVLVDAFGETISESLYMQLKAKEKNVNVVIRGVGRFKVADKPARPARMGRNPATGEPLKIKATRASKVLKASPDKAVSDDLKIGRRA